MTRSLLDCITVGFPPGAPVALRSKVDGTVVMYVEVADLLRVQRRAGRGWTA